MQVFLKTPFSCSFIIFATLIFYLECELVCHRKCTHYRVLRVCPEKPTDSQTRECFLIYESLITIDDPIKTRAFKTFLCFTGRCLLDIKCIGFRIWSNNEIQMRFFCLCPSMSKFQSLLTERFGLGFSKIWRNEPHNFI